MFPISSWSCLCSIHWSQVLSREWRCSWSSADRRCSNYVWVINNFIALTMVYLKLEVWQYFQILLKVFLQNVSFDACLSKYQWAFIVAIFRWPPEVIIWVSDIGLIDFSSSGFGKAPIMMPSQNACCIHLITPVRRYPWKWRTQSPSPRKTSCVTWEIAPSV